MIVGNIEIVTVLTILLFGLPLVVFSIKTNIFKTFSFGQLTKVFNKALVIQLIIALTLILMTYFFERGFYSNGQGNDLTDICMETAYTYLIIGTFFYLPGLIILNMINLILKKTIRTNE